MIKIRIEDIEALEFVPHGIYDCNVVLNGKSFDCVEDKDTQIIFSLSQVNRENLLGLAGFELADGILERKAFYKSFNCRYIKPKPVSKALKEAKELVKTLEELEV